MDLPFDRYNKEEFRLVCLNQNGQKALLDLLKYFINKDGESKCLHYSVPMTDPDILTQLRTDLLRYIHAMSPDNTLLISSVEELCGLEDFIACAHTNVYLELTEGVFTHARYPGIQSWGELWTFLTDNILNILEYLHTNKALDDCTFNHKCIEFKQIIPNEHKYNLYKKYHEAINVHYGLVKNIVEMDTLKENWVQQIPFSMQFTIDEFEGATPWSRRLGGLGAKKRMHYGDICLDSKFTDTLYNSVKNIFYDMLGCFNNDRYLILLTMATRETIKIFGKKEGLSSCTYECDFQPLHRQRLSSDYKDFTSPRVLENWNRHKGDIEQFVFDLLDIHVYAKRTSWYYGTAIKTNTGIDKRNRGKWTMKEMVEVDKAMMMAQEKFNRETKDLKLHTMRPIWYKCTGNINYTFELVLLSEGIREVAEGIIPLVQSTILQIPSY